MGCARVSAVVQVVSQVSMKTGGDADSAYTFPLIAYMIRTAIKRGVEACNVLPDQWIIHLSTPHHRSSQFQFTIPPFDML